MNRKRKIIFIVIAVAILALLAYVIFFYKKDPVEPAIGFPEFPNVSNELPGLDSEDDPFGTPSDNGSSGNIVVLDLSSEAAQENEALFRSEFAKPANYNGHFRLVEVSCGTLCTEYYTLDKDTGSIELISNPGGTATGGTSSTSGTGGGDGGGGDNGGNGTVGGGSAGSATLSYEEGDFGWDTSDESNWSDDPEGFNILTDLPELIAREKEYKLKLEDQIRRSDEVVNATYEFDQCIPGPRPGWDRDAENRLEEIINAIPTDWHQWDRMSGGLKRLIDYSNDKQAVQMFQSIAGLFTGDDKDDPFNRKMYKAILQELIGVDIKKRDNMESHGQIANALETLYTRYKDPINVLYKYDEPDYSKYSPAQQIIMGRMVALWTKDKDLYASLKSHYDGKKENNDLIGESIVLIYSLESFQTRIVNNMPAGIPKRSDGTAADFSAKIKAYEARLTPAQKTILESIERSFARIAPTLHTEDDLQEARDAIENLETERDDILRYIRDCITITGPGYPFALERMAVPGYSLAAGVGNPDKLTLGMSFLPDWSFYEGSTQIKDVNMQIQYRAIPVGDLFFLDGSTQQKTVWMLERLLLVY